MWAEFAQKPGLWVLRGYAQAFVSLVIAPWLLAHCRITDRVANFARANGIAMAAPLGPHRLVADTVLDRFEQAIAARVAA